MRVVDLVRPQDFATLAQWREAKLREMGLALFAAPAETLWTGAYDQTTLAAVVGYTQHEQYMIVTDVYRAPTIAGLRALKSLLAFFESRTTIVFAVPAHGGPHPMLRHLEQWGYAPAATLYVKGS